MRQQGDKPEVVYSETVKVVAIDYSDGPNKMRDLVDAAMKEFPDGKYLLDARETYSGAFTLRRYVYGVEPVPTKIKPTLEKRNEI